VIRLRCHESAARRIDVRTSGLSRHELYHLLTLFAGCGGDWIRTRRAARRASRRSWRRRR
jgi:hypothetical protein